MLGRWVRAVTAGEFVGFAVPAVVGAVVADRSAWVTVPGSSLQAAPRAPSWAGLKRGYCAQRCRPCPGAAGSWGPRRGRRRLALGLLPSVSATGGRRGPHPPSFLPQRSWSACCSAPLASVSGSSCAPPAARPVVGGSERCRLVPGAAGVLCGHLTAVVPRSAGRAGGTDRGLRWTGDGCSHGRDDGVGHHPPGAARDGNRRGQPRVEV